MKPLALFLLLLTLPAWADFDDGLAAYERGDYKVALQEFRPLAAQGYAGAQKNLGVMYLLGRGVSQDNAEAVAWFRRAAAQGYADAQRNLGVMYFQGMGVPRDFVQAHLWLNLAASQGYKDAIELRDQVASQMTSAQLTEARSLKREWLEKPPP